MAAQQQANDKSFLATEPLGKLMVRLAVPSIAAQLTSLLYNMVDRAFIGHIPGASTQALTGLGLCLPLVMVCMAFAAFAASGGTPLASMELGRKNHAAAQHLVAQVELLLTVFTVVVMVVCYAGMEPMLYLFGASDATYPYAQAYLQIYLLGTAFVMVSTGMSLFLLAQGDARGVLVTTVTGSLLNIVLDALFIFGFNWNIQGAAVATVISQGVSAVMVAHYLRKPTSALRMEFRLEAPDFPVIGKILSVGSGRFVILFTEGLLAVVLNATLANYGGDLYIGALTVLTSLQAFTVGITQGFTQGVQPIVSYCYGAGAIPRVRQTCKRILAVSSVLTFVLVGLCILFAHQCAGIFTSDPQMVQMAADYMPLFMFGMLFFGLQLGLQTLFMGLGRGFCSLVVASVRKVVLFIPLAVTLPLWMGADGVFTAEPASDCLSIVFCSTLFALTIPKMLRKAEEKAGSGENATPKAEVDPEAEAEANTGACDDSTATQPPANSQ